MNRILLISVIVLLGGCGQKLVNTLDTYCDLQDKKGMPILLSPDSYAILTESEKQVIFDVNDLYDTECRGM